MEFHGQDTDVETGGGVEGGGRRNGGVGAGNRARLRGGRKTRESEDIVEQMKKLGSNSDALEVCLQQQVGEVKSVEEAFDEGHDQHRVDGRKLEITTPRANTPATD